ARPAADPWASSCFGEDEEPAAASADSDELYLLPVWRSSGSATPGWTAARRLFDCAAVGGFGDRLDCGAVESPSQAGARRLADSARSAGTARHRHAGGCAAPPAAAAAPDEVASAASAAAATGPDWLLRRRRRRLHRSLRRRRPACATCCPCRRTPPIRASPCCLAPPPRGLSAPPAEQCGRHGAAGRLRHRLGRGAALAGSRARPVPVSGLPAHRRPAERQRLSRRPAQGAGRLRHHGGLAAAPLLRPPHHRRPAPGAGPTGRSARPAGAGNAFRRFGCSGGGSNRGGEGGAGGFGCGQGL
uniref:BUG/TctC family periplasmic protein n=1 Tax=Macrostomum lignano TaxID=282301 RepID=A0A1I8F1Y5_9PLAT